MSCDLCFSQAGDFLCQHMGIQGSSGNLGVLSIEQEMIVHLYAHQSVRVFRFQLQIFFRKRGKVLFCFGGFYLLRVARPGSFDRGFGLGLSVSISGFALGF